MRLYRRLMSEGGFTPHIDHEAPFERHAYYVELTKQVAQEPEKYVE